MHDALTFGLVVLAVSAAGLLAVQSHAVSRFLRVPAPALFLSAAALAAALLPSLSDPDPRIVARAVSLCLVVILFYGGLGIGARRMRSAAGPVLRLGLLGTFATVAGATAVVHLLLGVSWYLAVLVATAISPTDPAVVFSVLGQREVGGLSGTVLEGESGANDPVGIALMAALISAGSLSSGAVGDVAGTFALQMTVGAAIGVVGSQLLLRVMRTPLPAQGLYPVRVLLAAGLLFGGATALHGSGFLAVFVAGILLGDEDAPHQSDVVQFHAALASLAEVVAFTVLGLTVDLDELSRTDVWLPGLGIAALLALVVRPLVGLPLLLPDALTRGERAFVLLVGLKGAVPLLLGTMLLPLPGGPRLYGVVVVVVVVSVVVQGGLVPTAARVLRVGLHERPADHSPGDP